MQALKITALFVVIYMSVLMAATVIEGRRLAIVRSARGLDNHRNYFRALVTLTVVLVAIVLGLEYTAHGVAFRPVNPLLLGVHLGAVVPYLACLVLMKWLSGVRSRGHHYKVAYLCAGSFTVMGLTGLALLYQF